MTTTGPLPSTRRSRVHVALCADRDFAMPLAVALTSLASSAVLPTTVHVVHSGFDATARRRVLASVPDLEVEWHEIDRSVLEGVHNTDGLTDAALFRLTLGETLPAEVRRVLYLDADVLVTRDLGDLHAHDLGGTTIGAVRDAFSPWAAGTYGSQWRELGLRPTSPYFNSGVLVIDLNRWRATGAGAACLDVLRRTDPRWGDQDALNAVFEDAWTELPRRWNVQTPDLEHDSFSWVLATDEIAAAVADPAVIHFTSRRKPWVPGSAHPAADRWFEVLDRTSWRGWRPAAPVHERRGLEAVAVRSWRRLQRWRATRRDRLPR